MRRAWAAAFAVLAPAGAWAGWSPDPAVNTPVPLSKQFYQFRQNPTLARDVDGNLLVFWCEVQQQFPPTHQTFHALGARLSAGGEVIQGGAEISMIQTCSEVIAGTAPLPGVGTAVGLTTDLIFGGSGRAWVRALGTEGTLWSTGASDPPVGAEYGTSLAGIGSASGQGVAVAWVRQGVVRVQRISATGVREWMAAGQPVTAPPEAGWGPTVVSDDADGAIVVWTRDAFTLSSRLAAQRLSPSGALLWPGAVPVAPGAGAQSESRVVGDGAGGVIAAWMDDRSHVPEVYAQRIDAGGNLLWGTGGVRVASGVGVTSPRLVALAGGAVVAWTDLRSGTADVYAQRLTADGVPLWPASGLIVTAAPGDQKAPALVADGTGGVILAWQDHRGATWDVYAQRLSPTGQGMWIDSGRPVSIAPQDQVQVTVLADGSGGAYVAWMDTRNDVAQVYAAHVHATGVLPVVLERFGVE